MHGWLQVKPQEAEEEEVEEEEEGERCTSITFCQIFKHFFAFA